MSLCWRPDGKSRKTIALGLEDGPTSLHDVEDLSGMLVQDPTKGGHNVDAIFDQARQMGAMQGSFDELHPSSSSRSFTGTGRLLSGETVPAAPRPPENVVHNIYFWTNGFTIDDGPLRRFDDPANASFLESIKGSECPKELEPEDRRSTVHVNLIKEGRKLPSFVLCQEPVRRLTPFQGVGRTLGVICSESVAQEPAAAAAAPVVVDDSRPTTSVQLRLADGSRTVARFNTDHTVGDIRAFINNHAAIIGRAAPAAYTSSLVMQLRLSSKQALPIRSLFRNCNACSIDSKALICICTRMSDFPTIRRACHMLTSIGL